MDMEAVGARIRRQREYMGLTREELAEELGVTPKFCADIELGVKGMSVPTLCRLSRALRLTTDYILWGTDRVERDEPLIQMLQTCSDAERRYAEQLLKTFLAAMSSKESEKQG